MLSIKDSCDSFAVVLAGPAIIQLGTEFVGRTAPTIRQVTGNHASAITNSLLSYRVREANI